jgi:hypothetical protein
MAALVVYLINAHPSHTNRPLLVWPFVVSFCTCSPLACNERMTFQLRGNKYPASLVDLPCPVET